MNIQVFERNHVTGYICYKSFINNEERDSSLTNINNLKKKKLIYRVIINKYKIDNDIERGGFQKSCWLNLPDKELIL